MATRRVGGASGERPAGWTRGLPVPKVLRSLMVRIAQLSDFHLLEPGHASRRGLRSWRLSFLSAHRALDAGDRVARARRALDAARAADPDHVVITGDLTEDGTTHQFEALAELLHGCGVAPS